MKFQKGKSGNPEGRKKGAKNKTSEELRSAVQHFIELNWNRIQKDFDLMKPAERVLFLNSLLRHVLPEPVSMEKLTEDQLKQLHEYLIKKYTE